MTPSTSFTAPPLVLDAPSKPGAVVVDTPVILAPMAGVTTAAFRQLCAEQGAGLYVCEMITAKALVLGNQKTRDMLVYPEGEKIHSVQIYGVDPVTVGDAVEICCAEYGVDHLDLNFGCPVRKVTAKGGGGVLPWKLDRFEAIVKSAVSRADPYGVPVTVKTRIGIDPDHITYLDAGKAAEQAGAAAVCLHARTVAQAYSGHSDWNYITSMVEALSIPVIGNGDIWEALDAVEMMSQTGCAAVEVGRGCLGRPWLFRDLAAAMAGRREQLLPNLAQVCQIIERHAQLQAKYMGEAHGMRDFRKHIAWYLRGFGVGGSLRHELSLVSSLDELSTLLARLDQNQEYPSNQLGRPRGRQGTPQRKVAMPDGWLNSRQGCDLDLSDAELDVSGG